ncbi:hypothetical protein [Hymenobacter sp. B1770]|uniref:hypothetical protein n=1 Tax=Hymenobacter sp. B1770 TaxID=1718788 RepID=UPI003CF50345
MSPAKHGLAGVWEDVDFNVGYDFTQTFEFTKATVTGPDGKTHEVYVPLSSPGFADLLPFFRRKEDIDKFGSVPLNISVDKVQTIQANGYYFEHLMLKGKRQHILGARLVNGPVELFNYTKTKRISESGPNMYTNSYTVYPKRHWYLRRQGELVEVSRNNFIPQLTEYFKDEPAVVAALTNQELRYRDMVALVMAYNEGQANATAKP